MILPIHSFNPRYPVGQSFIERVRFILGAGLHVYLRKNILLHLGPNLANSLSYGIPNSELTD